MPWPESRKAQTKTRILCSAIKLFAEKGFNNVSLGEIMKDAKLTHGAFYAHFDSKQSLYKEAVVVAKDSSPLGVAAKQPEVRLELSDILGFYLSEGHVEQRISPCPLAAFATDVSHQESEIKQSYTQVFQGLLSVLESKIEGDDGQKQSAAKAIAAMMIGGVVVSRALDDKALVKDLLEACVTHAASISE
ncbi:TetR/AcrR family transcriptional regulator [Enterovibrio nigricans]|uniref:Transcriptional regulator, TetR family n=1 Tax=Enterovibrio nigricans DSM 22720 TaxID=1121868 RepID=A0A1T4UMU5_9GAMM|nr:TetR/AcrR family transcriptional regulator [Enterovibrio nigricans]PKF49488.1 TetR/AcrR family transcriptional regulator [Enterovibrio nigricans]SKA53761.1 transcriptional regulator, TetR family [Enterovibrio nigricans DSM 22720]